MKAARPLSIRTALTLLAALLSTIPTAAAERPNIIFIMADDLGYSDLGCYGGEIETPHLDQLAAGGLRFRQFYNEAKCTESRASLLTGHTHHQSRNMRDRSIPTVAELLRAADYRTLLVGKWHLPDTPLDRGFDRYFGFLNGAVNFWTGVPSGRNKKLQWLLDDQPYNIPASGFYTTDAFTDRAIEFIDEAAAGEEPFFLYLAHNAPHYPLHAWPKDIAKYRGKYKQGWDTLRKDRLARMRKTGIVPGPIPLSERDPNVPAWDALSKKDQEEYALLMAVYAAMVDRLDQNIGRLVSFLEERNLLSNTVILFCSDNGGCPYQNEEKPDSTPGGPESHRTYNTPWANASNTPFRLYKRFSHEGGIATPMIVHWPDGIQARGQFTDQQGHLMDLLPTFLTLAGAEVPEQVAGENLVPAFQGNPFERQRPLFWEFMKHRAVRESDYKLVGEAGGPWRLYNIPADRIESNDLSQDPAQADRVQRLSALYDQWARQVNAPSSTACENASPMRMKDYTKELTPSR